MLMGAILLLPVAEGAFISSAAGAVAQLSRAKRPPNMSTNSPSPELSPVAVTEIQLGALQRGDVQTCFAHASPGNKAMTGPWQRFEIMVRQTPAYAPLVGCTRFAVVGALPTGPSGYRCRVRVWPAGGSSAPFAVMTPVLDYDWVLSKQHGDEVEGCWMVDGVVPDAAPKDAWDSARD